MNTKKTMLAVLLLASSVFQAKAQESYEDLDGKYATTLVQPGTIAPDFTLTTPDGLPLSLNTFKGKTVVLDFWASWCSDCRRDAPEVVRLYNEYHSPDIEFVGISMDTSVESWKKAINEYGILYPQASELKKFKETEIAIAYGVQWIPSMVVISPEGKVLLSTVQYQKLERFLKDR